jgi:hypothetical protein
VTPLYPRVLGPSFDALPPALRALHGGPGRWSGTATLTHGGRVARLASRTMGYPDRDGAVPLVLTIQADGDGEIWHRDFDGARVVSWQGPGPHGTIRERLGATRLNLRPEPAPGGLRLTIAGAALGPLPTPPVLRGGGIETVEGDAVRFDVSATLPGLGLLIRYRGLLSRLD